MAWSRRPTPVRPVHHRRGSGSSLTIDHVARRNLVINALPRRHPPNRRRVPTSSIYPRLFRLGIRRIRKPSLRYREEEEEDQDLAPTINIINNTAHRRRHHRRRHPRHPPVSINNKSRPKLITIYLTLNNVPAPLLRLRSSVAPPRGISLHLINNNNNSRIRRLIHRAVPS